MPRKCFNTYNLSTHWRLIHQFHQLDFNISVTLCVNDQLLSGELSKSINYH